MRKISLDIHFFDYDEQRMLKYFIDLSQAEKYNMTM